MVHLRSFQFNDIFDTLKSSCKLSKYEINWCQLILTTFSHQEFVFDSSKSRILVKKTVLVFSKKLLSDQYDKVFPRQNLNVGAICLGYPKCATTWFYNTARKLDTFDLGGAKELEFFSSLNILYGYDWYENNFDSRSNKIKLDISVGYFNDNYRNIQRIIDYQTYTGKDIKFLIFVRNPYDRFVSYITYRMLSGRGYYSFDKYVKSSHALNNFILSSDYQSDIIKLLKSNILPKNLFVVFQEDIKENPKLVFAQIYDYLYEKGISVSSFNNFNFNVTYNKGKSVSFFRIHKALFDIEAFLYTYFHNINSLIFIFGRIFYRLRLFLIQESSISNNHHKISSHTKELFHLNNRYKNLKKFLSKNLIKFSNTS